MERNSGFDLDKIKEIIFPGHEIENKEKWRIKGNAKLQFALWEYLKTKKHNSVSAQEFGEEFKDKTNVSAQFELRKGESDFTSSHNKRFSRF